MFGKYKKRFLSYLNKENFDYNQGYVDPYEFHSCFITFARLFSVMDYDKLSYWMYISPVVVAYSGALAALICLISLTRYIRDLDIQLITEAGTYFILMCYKMVIVSCTFVNKKQYHSFLQTLREDFQYICSKEVKYKDKFFENQKFTFKMCVMASIFVGFIGLGMAVMACITLLFFLAIHGKGNVSERPLPFPSWLFDYDLKATPTFQFYFCLSMGFTFCHTYSYIFMMQAQIQWVTQIMCKADIIIMSIEDLLRDIKPAKSLAEEEYYTQIIHSRMREIIIMHHSMLQMTECYAAVYKKCLLYEQKLAGPIICLTAYCFAEKLNEGEIKGMLLQLCVGAIVLSFIPSYLCTLLLVKVQSVSDACWNTPFWNAGPVVRTYLVLMMQRAMRKLPIVAAGFDDISLQTYSKVLTRAYSCFNMLRQGRAF